MAGQNASKSRMFILLPLLFFSNKISFDNVLVLNGFRTVFLLLQLLSLSIGYYLKYVIEKKKDERKIYVPSVVSPFAAPNTNETTETTYYAYELAKVKEFMNQTMIGAVISFFIHYKFGVNQVVLIQSFMIPLNLYDNLLIHKYLFHKENELIWNEKFTNDTTQTKEVTTENKSKEVPIKRSNSISTKSEIINKTWDDGENMNILELYETLKGNPNLQTEYEGWTGLMVACGLKSIKNNQGNQSITTTKEFIQKMIEAGANIFLQDNDGWTVLHWAAFHGQLDNVKSLLSLLEKQDIEKLLNIQDNNNCTALMVAKNEENQEIYELLKSYETIEENETNQQNLQRRKNPRHVNEDSIHNVD